MRFESVMVLAVATLATASVQRGRVGHERLARREVASTIMQTKETAVTNLLNTINDKSQNSTLGPGEFLADMEFPEDPSSNISVVAMVCNIAPLNSSIIVNPDVNIIMSMKGTGLASPLARRDAGWLTNSISKLVGYAQYWVLTDIIQGDLGSACGTVALNQA